MPAEEIRENGYDLSVNKYKEIEYQKVEYPPTEEILGEIEELQREMTEELGKLGKPNLCKRWGFVRFRKNYNIRWLYS